MTDLFAVFIAAIVGWNVATVGRREMLGMALVVAGWTAVDTAAMVPYLSGEFFLRNLANHAAAVCIPFVVAALLRRLLKRAG